MPSVQHLDILGSRVAYWVFNPEKPRVIVMVHGFRGTHHGLHDIIAQLPDFQVIIPDLPGFGASSPMDKRAHNIAGYSAFTQELIKQLSLNKPVLLGHSFGSIIAAEVATSAPQLISKLILINAIAMSALQGPRTVLNKSALLYYRIGAKLPEKIGHALLSNRAVVQLTSSLLAKTSDKKLRQDIHRHHQQHFSSFQTRQVLLEAFDASIHHSVLDYASGITMPTLLIAGAVDDIAPLSGQHALVQKIPDAELVVIPGVGHLIHREAPREAAEAIRRFIA